MVRRLLKRKLRITKSKKLKTIKRTFSSLGLWALKQLQKPPLLTPYPKDLSLSFYLHRKQLLSQLVTSNTNFGVNRVHGNNFGPLDSTSFLPNIGKVALEKKEHNSQSAQPSCVAGTADLTHRNFSKPSGLWPLYTLVKKKPILTSNWKGIYSLDQLMCHQYESLKHFTRRESKLKISLLENQKLRTLYGKFPLKQLARLSLELNSQRPHHMALLLESRLDVALKSCFVFNTLGSAQHWVQQGRILVNSKTIKSPSYILKPGDVFTIGKHCKERYKKQFLNAFYKIPKESKFIESGRLLSHWKLWASLYNSLASHKDSGLEQKNKLIAFNKSKICKPKAKESHPGLISQNDVESVAKPMLTLPDKAISAFWYNSGRDSWKTLYKLEQSRSGSAMGNPYQRDNEKLSKHKLKGYKSLALDFPNRVNHLFSWLREQRWLKRRIKVLRFRHWKTVYRRRILLFSRWLLSAKPLTEDGLYFLRWHRGFIRKKSTLVKENYRGLSLQKALQFEVSYKKLCAIYLYAPQRIVLPFMIDFRKV